MGKSLSLVVLGAGMADRDHLDEGLIPNLMVLAEQQGESLPAGVGQEAVPELREYALGKADADGGHGSVVPQAFADEVKVGVEVVAVTPVLGGLPGTVVHVDAVPLPAMVDGLTPGGMGDSPEKVTIR